MAKLFYDLHIHSALSPCADDDMTPNNIVHMAKIKGLDILAISDHNSAKNLGAAARIADEAGLLFLPAIEMTTMEEVHLLALFEEVEKAEAFGDFLYESLPDIKNEPSFFGNQYIMDENDEVVGSLEKLLISALPFDMGECFALAGQYGGRVVPAHVNKGANSVFANLGFMPADLPISTVEVVTGLPTMGDVSKYFQLCNSDAHTLGAIAERENFLELDGGGRKNVLKLLFP